MIAPPWFPTPPRRYGGIEFVVSLLTEGLVRRGHDVTLFASGDSMTTARLSYVFEQALQGGRMEESRHLEVIHALEAYARSDEFDVIHDHDGAASRIMGALTHRLSGQPVVATLHGPADVESQQLLSALRSDLCFIAISEYQRRGFPDLRFVGTIPNAIQVEELPYSAEKDDFFLFIGRMIPDKGAHTAVEVARRLGARLILGGKVNEPAEREYFAREVEPYLTDTIHFRGEVDHQTKAELYRRARCTLFPIQWPEPFGLVMVESLAAGTPVIAFRQGSVPEVIEHGRTGFVVEDLEQMVEAARHLDEIDPAECRRAAVERFGTDAFVAAHERAYERLLGSETACGAADGDGAGQRDADVAGETDVAGEKGATGTVGDMGAAGAVA
jgi:glycosyltransferase involved in cell wall biosynthesis